MAGLGFTVVGGLQFCWRDVPAVLVEPAVIEPHDPFGGGQLDLVDVTPRVLAGVITSVLNARGGFGRALVPSSTAPDPVGDQRTVRVTHHSIRGWGGSLCFSRCGRRGRRIGCSSWTGMAGSSRSGGLDGCCRADVFVTMAAGRSPFRFADLVVLRRLIDGLSD